jgi:hypothetical protein
MKKKSKKDETMNQTSGPTEPASWAVEKLSKTANSVGFSRRTDGPAFYPTWFSNRLDAGYADYMTAWSRQRYRCSLLPENVTHFVFWTKNPTPFLPVLEKVLEIGFPVLWHCTVTGLGGTPVEPHVPSAKAVVASVRKLSQMVPPSAIMWRYDPIVVSDLHGQDFHVETFTHLAGELAGHVDRIAVSFLGSCYARQVQPDLKRYEDETGDQVGVVPIAQQVDLASKLHGIAQAAGLQLTLCCSPELQKETGYAATGCNSFSWARRVYPALEKAKLLKSKPTREGCECDDERDIGVFDSCIHGCRYSYGSKSYADALANFKKHDPLGPCIIPADSSPAARPADNIELPIIAPNVGIDQP